MKTVTITIVERPNGTVKLKIDFGKGTVGTRAEALALLAVKAVRESMKDGRDE